MIPQVAYVGPFTCSRWEFLQPLPVRRCGHCACILGQLGVGICSDVSKGFKIITPGNIIIEVWKIIFLSKWMICRFHVTIQKVHRLKEKWTNVLEKVPFQLERIVFQTLLFQGGRVSFRGSMIFWYEVKFTSSPSMFWFHVKFMIFHFSGMALSFKSLEIQIGTFGLILWYEIWEASSDDSRNSQQPSSPKFSQVLFACFPSWHLEPWNAVEALHPEGF